MFNCSDLYSSDAFNIHKKFKQFIQTIADYTMMNDEELNLNTFIEQNKEDEFIIISEDVTKKNKKFQLKQKLIVIQ